MSTGKPLQLGFRRRCCWCGVELRAWQLNACRMCKRAIVHSPSPPAPSGTRWTAEPDRLFDRSGS